MASRSVTWEIEEQSIALMLTGECQVHETVYSLILHHFYLFMDTSVYPTEFWVLAAEHAVNYSVLSVVCMYMRVWMSACVDVFMVALAAFLMKA